VNWLKIFGTSAVSRSTWRKGVVALSIGAALASAEADSIPYQSALDAAAVNEADVSNISTKGLVVGNGELNAIVYSSGNDLHLRVSKNDCWDMRINTAGDGSMPTVNASTGAFTSSSTPSWNYPYPTALPCTDITLGAVSGQTSWTSANLDLTKAVATVVSNADTTAVRVLSQSNVILVNSSRAITLNGISGIVKDHTGASISSWVSAADSGTQAGYTYLHQNIPGDADASGMDIYIVVGASGTKQAIAVVTSRDSATPLNDAVNLVTATLGDANAVATHEAAWQAFWAKSGVSLGDVTLQNWWYRMVYFFRCFSRGGGNSVGLQAAFDSLGGWHDSLKLNYNIQQAFLAAGPINHPELIEPFTGALTRNLNRAKWFATTNFTGSQGAFFHSDLWPFEPDPANCTTKNKHQLAYMPWGYSWGMDGHSAAVLWDYYKYNPSPTTLNAIYPVLQQFALFYCSMLEQCALVNGVRKIGPSYFPENGSYGQYNVCYDISFINCCLKAALTAATLEGDTALVNRISARLSEMPNYSTVNDSTASVNGTVVEEWLGSGLQGKDNHGTSVQAIFPAGQIGIFSSAADQALYTRTIQHVENITTHANSNVTINIARARLGLGAAAIANAKMCFDTGSSYSPQQPNGLFYWNAHGYYICEQVCIARLVSELLLQSVGDVIRIFPAWPSGADGHFNKLLAQGGFEVSADRVSNAIQNVTIRSTQGGAASLAAPWAGFGVKVTAQSTGSAVPTTNANGIYSFLTTAGETYQVSPGAATVAPSAPAGLSASGGDTIVSLSWSAGAAATSYSIQRSTDGVNFTTVGTSTGTAYVDDGLTNGTTYYYQVSSVNDLGQSGNSTPVSVSPTNQGSISIDFQGGSSTNGTPALMGPSEVAGYFPASNWNSAPGTSGTASSLVQSNGIASSASVTWAANNIWSTSITDTAGNNRMMKGYLDTSSSSTTTVTVSGLPAALASAGYSIYVYRDGDNGASAHSGSYKIGATTISATDSANTNFSGTFTQANNSAGNYVVFANQTGTSFTLTAQPTVARAPINGIQIIGRITNSPPQAPIGLTPGPVTSTSVQLTWTDTASDESAFRVEYSPSGANNWIIVGETAAGSTSYRVTGLNAGTPYDFRVQAMSGGGVASSTVATVNTLTPYQQWKVDNNLPLNTADSVVPDGDGIPILLKYATGMAVGAPGKSPVASSTSGGSPLTLTFQRLSPAPVTYVVQVSTDMSTWTTIATLAKGSDVWSGPGGVQEVGTGGLRTATASDTTLPSAANRRFMRLQVAP
jgi:hypothetical protein